MTSTSLVLWIAMARLTLCLTELHLLILLPLLRRPHNIATPSICATLFSTKNAAKVTIRMKEDLSILLSVWGFFSLFKLVHVELTKRSFVTVAMIFPTFVCPLQLRYFENVFLLMRSSCSHPGPLCLLLFSNRVWELNDVYFG